MFLSRLMDKDKNEIYVYYSAIRNKVMPAFAPT
jgi:hypothetical protein